MTTTVQAGTILIDDEPRLTQIIALKSEPYSGKWSVLKGLDGFALDREIRAAGWHFFFLAAEVKVMFFGVIRARKVQDALKRILGKVRSQNFNCLEVTGIVAKRFWGIPYATVSAHSRHIQQSCQLDDIDRRRAGQGDAEWARG
jgi:hypothetical protein